MIPYIGDLSKNDAKVLRELAQGSTHILEFGVGASTQVLRHYSKGSMVSVETIEEWVIRTKKNFKLVGVEGEVNFIGWDDDCSGRYDFIFVDGHKRLRKEFAEKAWRYLAKGGHMAFHDTRKEFHIDYVCEILKQFYCEIEMVTMNYMDSNITIIQKRTNGKLVYENWNQTEMRPSWQYGRGEFDQKEFDKYKERMKG